jgi:hypothetical protein
MNRQLQTELTPRSLVDRDRKYPREEKPRSAFVFGKLGVAAETHVFSQHVAGKKPEHPRAEHDEGNPVHGHNRERNVDEDFAEINRIPGSCEEPILDQAFSFPQYVELLRITHVVKKDAGDARGKVTRRLISKYRSQGRNRRTVCDD